MLYKYTCYIANLLGIRSRKRPHYLSQTGTGLLPCILKDILTELKDLFTIDGTYVVTNSFLICHFLADGTASKRFHPLISRPATTLNIRAHNSFDYAQQVPAKTATITDFNYSNRSNTRQIPSNQKQYTF